MSDAPFCGDYHEDRAAFVEEVERFAERSGRSHQMHRFVVDPAHDLSVSVAELPAVNPEKLYVLSCGIHGVEGYAGSAILRQLVRHVLPKLSAENTSLLLVHALNPYGFFHSIRVNRHNVDLNRNCAALGETLFGSVNPDFSVLRGVLGPARACSLSLRERVRFYIGIGQALASAGAGALRQATLGGQYEDPSGVFFGGAQIQPEIAFFQDIYARLAQSHGQVLLTDLHTGYGVRGRAYPLFGRADSPDFQAYTQSGVKDSSGTDKAYTVQGDLVGYCYKTSKRVHPGGTFNGVVIELGTHGLSMRDQLSDLHTVVTENQLRQHGAVDEATARTVRAQFRELFYPQDPAWRRKALAVGVDTIQRLLQQRGYL
jgi:hypothetical protein